MARYRTTSEVVSVTSKVATPAELVATPEAGLITDEPFNAVSPTMMPGTGFLLWSSSVTVTVDAVVPSAGTLVGLACTDD